MAIIEKTVTSVSEYFEAIKGYGKGRQMLWYRGHASNEWKLSPSIYRNPYNAEKERGFMNLFKAKGVKFFPDKEGYFEWLFLMQHYGTPTRLLDWSESAMVALAFATQYRNQETEKKDAVVWCLDPLKINELAKVTSGTPDIINICEEKDVSEIYQRTARKGAKPIAILGSYGNERIIAQKGVFTLFPIVSDSLNLEDDGDAEQFLMKIVIPQDQVKEIADELYFAGITELSLFPEPDSISKEIKRIENAKGV